MRTASMSDESGALSTASTRCWTESAALVHLSGQMPRNSPRSHKMAGYFRNASSRELGVRKAAAVHTVGARQYRIY